jgi:TonB-linked SusC/RagA family outer membrane protein
MRISCVSLTALVAAIALSLGAAPQPLQAQSPGTIRGTVLDASTGETLAGAQVNIRGTGIGTITNNSGQYILRDVPAGTIELRVQYVGYATEQRTVTLAAGGVATEDFQLGISAIQLDKVVVTATGEQRARELGHSVESVNAEQTIETKPVSSLTGLLTGQIAGVRISQSSGSVASASSLKVRGNTSLGLDNTPIIYVDGARIDNNNEVGGGAGGQDFTRINDISPEDIASIEVVKGPAAATLYGTDASSGVIRITTKKGASGDARWTFRAEYGALWDATDWWSQAWSTTEGAGLELLTGVPAAKDTVYDMNLLEGQAYLDAPFRTGTKTSYGASVRGGTQAVRYYVSGDYLTQEGVLQGDDIERYNFRANIDSDVSDNVRIAVNGAFTSSFAGLPTNDNSLYGYVGNALGTPWYGPMVAADPISGGAEIETCFIAFELARAGEGDLQDLTDAVCDSPYFVAVPNSMEKIGTIRNDQGVERFTGSATIQWTPLQFWNNRFTVGYDQHASRTRNIYPVDPVRPFGNNSEGFIARTDLISRNLTLEGTSAVSFQLTPDLNSVTTGGFQWFRETDDFTYAEGQEFPAGSPSVGNSVVQEATDGFTEARTLGFFIQEQLSWRDRMFLVPGVRFDDNSAFGSELETEAYPRLSFSWIMSEEDWFPTLVDQFKFRAAWGESGKRPGTNAALALLSPLPVAYRGVNVLGVTNLQPGNPDLRPAVSQEWEVGFDASVLQDRVGLSLTYFDKTTKDDIVAQQDAPSLGFPAARFVNIGELQASGLEMAVKAAVVNRESVTWDATFTLATLDGEITELPEPIDLGTQQHREGFPFASYFARPVTIDDNGLVVVADTAEFVGHPTPEWEGSVSSTVTLFDRFTLFGLIDYAGGHQLENGLESFNCGLFGGGGQFGTCPEIFEKDANGELTDAARIKDEAAGVGSDAPFIYDADYAKLRTLSLRIDLPDEWFESIGGTGVSLTLSGDDLYTWTDYPGTDPEVNFAGGNQVVRAQLWTLPPARRFTTRFQISF